MGEKNNGKIKKFSQKRQAAFLFFATKILEGPQGVFLSLDRTDFDLEPEFYFGFGARARATNGDKEIPKFWCLDWEGSTQQETSFKKNWNHKSFSKNCHQKISDKKNKETQKILESFDPQTEAIKSGKNSETEASFSRKVQAIQKHQKNGNIWVLNLTQNFFGTHKLNLQDQKIWLLSSFFKFLKEDPKHCGGVWITQNKLFASFSPEIFASQNGLFAQAFPIKGTGTQEFLKKSEKEKSELSMITDLVRNDWGQIAQQVSVTKERFITQSNNFFHSQSAIKVFLKDSFNLKSIQKLLPAGSISGAPKKKAVETIKKLENFDRRFYTGIFGVQVGDKKSIFNILIRTLFLGEKNWYFPTGSGITIESNGKSEYEECLKKQNAFHQFCWGKISKRESKNLFFLYGPLCLFFLDQITKFWARNFFSNPLQPFDILPFFQLKFVENTGVAFSLPVSPIFTIPLGILAILLLVFLIFFRAENSTKYLDIPKRFIFWEKIAFSLILAGALGNTVDRIYFDRVTDFLSFWSFPIFNLADVWIFLGISAFVFLEFWKERQK